MANYQQDNQEVKPKRSPLDDAMIKKIKGDAPVDDFYFNRGVKTYNKMMARPGASETTGPEPQAADLERLGKATTNTSVMGAVGDIAKGVVTRAIPDTLSSIATVIDDPYTKNGILDSFIDNRKKAQQEYINSAGADDIAIPFTTITRREMREGVSSLGFSAAAWGAARLGGAAAGAAAGTLTGIPLAGTATGAVLGFIGGAASAGALAYKMDKNAFIREYRSFLEKQKGQPITDEEFAQYKSGKIADLLSEHGLHEAGWEGIFTAVEQGTLARLGGGLTSKALKGIASLALFELGSEAGTQIGQSNVEVKLGMSDEPMRSYMEPKDWLQSAREVLPAILVMSGVTGGVEAGVGYVQDKVKEGRVNALKEENLDVPTLVNMANDPVAMRERGLDQADVITVAREKVKGEFLADIDERGYGPKELAEIKKDKDLMASAGITEEDIDTRIVEAEQEVATTKAAMTVDPEQERLKAVSNKVANLSSLPNKTQEEEQRLAEAQAERDSLINAGVQEPEAAKIAEESGEALYTRIGHLSTQLMQLTMASRKRKLTPVEQERKAEVETKINDIKTNKAFTDYVASMESDEASEIADETSAVAPAITEEPSAVVKESLATAPVVETVTGKESLQVAPADPVKAIISERGFNGLRGPKNAPYRRQINEALGATGDGYATMITKLKEQAGVTSTAPKDIERDVVKWAAQTPVAAPIKNVSTAPTEQPPTLPNEQRTKEKPGEVAATGQGKTEDVVKEPWEMTQDEAVNRTYPSGEKVPKAPDGAMTKLNGQSATVKDGIWRFVTAADGRELVVTDPVVRKRLDHRYLVEQAHAAGKPVPAENLKEYGLEKQASEQKNEPAVEEPEVDPETLRGIMIKMDAMVEGTGDTKEFEVDAAEAYQENRDQQSVFENILNCLAV